MKKKSLLAFVMTLLLAGSFSATMAQPCIVDLQYGSPGIYPNDTLQDMMVTMATHQVVQFVFPLDTVVLGFTLNFDSFVVSNVGNVPPGLTWQCNLNHPYCHYVSAPPSLTRGCVRIDGAPTASTNAYPAYDSIIVTGVAYVTVPFVGVQSFAQDIPIRYRVSPMIAASSPFAHAGLGIAPVPVSGTANVRYSLTHGADVKVTVVDLMGREVAVLSQGMQRAGEQELVLDAKDLAAGSYLLQLNINNGEYVQTKKFTSMR